jgi:gamma-glutamyl-gamma-aminobutyrate hydrolase PuuD
MSNHSPVVGLLLLHSRAAKHSESNIQFVQKEYSKWLEQVNIRWIPLYMEESEEQTRLKMSKIDGVFLTGGAEPFLKLAYKKRINTAEGACLYHHSNDISEIRDACCEDCKRDQRIS